MQFLIRARGMKKSSLFCNGTHAIHPARVPFVVTTQPQLNE
jgi:hypothetical protein